MAEHLQYIGARYVPKFADPVEWQTNAIYEPFTIVTRFGNSYTSKKAVPAGIDPFDNSEYWAATGNFNAQLEQYGKDVEDLKKNVETTLADQDAAIKGQASEIERLNSNISALSSNYVVMIGDSYGEQNSDGDISSFYWEQIRDNLGLTDGVSFWGFFESGAGFINGNFLKMLNRAVTATTADQKTKISKVVVCGGWNDSLYDYTDAQFRSAYNQFKSVVKSNFPNAEIVVAHISWGLRDNQQDATVPQLWNSLRKYSAVGTMGGKYITNSEFILHDYSDIWQTNGTHPNQKGQNRLARYLSGAIFTYSCDVADYVGNSTYATNGGIASEVANVDVFTSIHNDIVTINSNKIIALTLVDSTYHFDGNNEWNAFQLTNRFLEGWEKIPSVHVTGVLQLSDDTVVNIPITLRFKERDVYVVGMMPNGSAFAEYVNPKVLLIPRFSASFATMIC